MKYIVLIFVLVTVKSVNAQLFSTYWLYQFDEVENHSNYEHGQKFKSNLKVHNPRAYEYSEHLFGWELKSNINASLLFKDTALTKQFTYNDLSSLNNTYFPDTLRTCNPKTCEEKIETVQRRLIDFPSRNHAYRLKQDWYFNDSTQQLYSIIRSLTLVYMKSGKEVPVFTIKINDDGASVTEQDAKNDDFILIQRIKYNMDFGYKSINNLLLSDEHYRKNKVRYTIDAPMTVDEIKKIFEGSIDTTLVYDQDERDFVEKIVEKKAIKPEDVEKYYVYQDFYLDPKNMIIKSKVVTIMPLIEDEKDRFGYRTLFKIVYP